MLSVWGGRRGEGTLGLTSSSSLKIREKIKMKRTAEDLVIVYLEAKIRITRMGWSRAQTHTERGRSSQHPAGRGGGGAELPDSPEGNWLCSGEQCNWAQKTAEGGLSHPGWNMTFN